MQLVKGRDTKIDELMDKKSEPQDRNIPQQYNS
jgi:hypothetical protein